jgi:hypothetical protein
MQKEVSGLEGPASRELHPVIYKGMVALALWLVASIWSLARTPYTDFLLVVVTGFMGLTLLIPAALWWTRRRNRWLKAPADESFKSWIARPFETWQGRTTGVDAAVEILLPIAAVAFGMTALALVQFLEV